MGYKIGKTGPDCRLGPVDYTTFSGRCQQANCTNFYMDFCIICTKKITLFLKGDYIFFSYLYYNLTWLFGTSEAVIADIFANSHILPKCSVSVLVANCVIFRQRQIPIIHKLGFVVSAMFGGSPLQVICCANFQNICAVTVYVMPHI